MEDVLDSKYRRAKLYYLVKWRGYSKEESSWQPGKNLKDMQKVDAFHEQYLDKLGLELTCLATEQPPKWQQRKQKNG